MPTGFDRGSGSQFLRAFTSRNDDWTREAPGTEIPLTAATGRLARDGMSLAPDRWRVENYHRANGPILWQHDHSRPAIGNGRATVERDRLRVRAVFDQEDDFARSIESKLRRRILNSASVGWDFVDARTGEVIRQARGFAGNLAATAAYDLSETSIVNVGSDPFATAERHWRALRAIDPRLSALYDAQERTDSDMTGPELRRAVIDYCNHIGLDLRYIRAAVEGEDAGEVEETDGELSEDDVPDADAEPQDVAPVRRSRLPERVRSVQLPAPAVDVAQVSALTVDEQAAQTVLAAFGLR